MTKPTNLKIIVLSFILFLTFQTRVSAKIKIDIERTYEVGENNEMHVSEVETIYNDTTNQYIPYYENLTFTILGFRESAKDNDQILNSALATAIVSEGENKLNFTSEIVNGVAMINVPYGTNLKSGETRTFKLEYKHPALVFRNGVLIDIYIHAFAKDFAFETDNVIYNYTTRLKIPNSIGKEVNFVYPTPISTNKDSTFTTYEFSSDSLVSKFAWIQLGTHQVYHFKITQPIAASTDKLTGELGKYTMILPRDINESAVEQIVYFEKISPEAKSIYKDEEGNIFAEFEFFSNEQSEITIEGYAYLEKDPKIIPSLQSEDISKIPADLVTKYTASANYWEVNNSEIQQKAESLRGEESNVYKVSKNIYEYIVGSIDYSDVKRFGINERQGALKTLNGGAAVCMEYSDLFLTLERAVGIPSRAVFGYGYDPRESSDSQESHQWVQIYMPGLQKPWVDVDVTWGESGELLIGGDLNHFYTHIAYEDPHTPPYISTTSPISPDGFESQIFEIETEDLVKSDLKDMESIDDLIARYPYKNESEFKFFVRQMYYKFQAGFLSLKDGVDLQNSSQILVISTIAILLCLVVLLRPRRDWKS